MVKRRDLLKAAAALALVTGTGGRALAAVFRRVRPGEAAWPKPADWAALKRAVNGRLLEPEAIRASLANIGDHPGNPFFLGDEPAGTQLSGWFKAWTPAPSAYAVAAESGEDIAAAVNFARKHGLRLVVKGGAHSYQGTSNAPDSLLVWTRHMREVKMIGAFMPEGCTGSAPAVAVDAGAMWIDAYDTVTVKGGRYVQGGGCTTVGVAGNVQSGGFGSFSKGFGTAAGSLLEAEIVTADGKLRRVNQCQDPELFWGIKGGGGGSLGVVTKLVLRTHDLPEFFGFVSAVIRAQSDEAYRQLIVRFMAFYRDALCNPHWGESVQVRPSNQLHIGMVSQGLTEAEMKAAWQPFLDWVSASPGDYAFEEGPALGTAPARYWWDAEARKAKGSHAFNYDDRPGTPVQNAWWRDDSEQVGAYIWGYDSLWLPASLLGDADHLAASLVAASRHQQVELHFNKGLAGAPEEAISRAADTATNPAVLDAFALAIVANGGGKDDTAAQKGAQAVDAATAILAPLAPAGGSYVSESNYFNRDWAKAFWGRNYPRLLAAKRKYDPEGLFFVHHGVGSEDWSPDGFSRPG